MSLEDFLSSENDQILRELAEDPNKNIGIILFSLSHTLPIAVSKDLAGREVVIIFDSVPSERMSSEVPHHFRDIKFSK